MLPETAETAETPETIIPAIPVIRIIRIILRREREHRRSQPPRMVRTVRTDRTRIRTGIRTVPRTLAAYQTGPEETLPPTLQTSLRVKGQGPQRRKRNMLLCPEAETGTRLTRTCMTEVPACRDRQMTENRKQIRPRKKTETAPSTRGAEITALVLRIPETGAETEGL